MITSHRSITLLVDLWKEVMMEREKRTFHQLVVDEVPVQKVCTQCLRVKTGKKACIDLLITLDRFWVDQCLH